MDSLLWIILGVAGHVVLSAIMSEIAGRLYGSKFIWLGIFITLPGISYLIFFYIVWSFYKKKQAMGVVVDVTGGDSDSPYSTTSVNVTPFAEDGQKSDVPSQIKATLSPDEIPGGEEYINDLITGQESTKSVSVTPFDHSGEAIDSDQSGATGDGGDQPKSQWGKFEILKEWRDGKIDELMEYEEWEKAFDRAVECLKKAERVGDERSVNIYNAYVTLLRPRVLRL